ncbi:type I restriction endonuclease subunit R [Roseburia hominis]|uniref:type I restriction endonuclease subunit R n=1 Tax=Roseburia hominis TaxID=301301 RepID=UPI00258B3418|nr:DEAD/DEAH box helicase family protein [uncultured Bacteroides sp.]
MKENGFETLIVRYLVDNNHYEEGLNSEYNKTYAIDEGRLFRFLNDTQYKKMQELRIEESEIEKKKFLDRLSRKLSDDGVINIIRKGVKYKNHTLDFYMVQPSDGNVEAAKSYNKNIFSVTRQLRYSGDYGKLALDLCIFLNGLPIITMELKNQYTKQNYSDAIKQYKTDRTPDELLFQFKRCIVHFAVDDNEVHMCTELKRDKSFFLPFNKGNNNGAGNPNNPNGIKTDYLWKDILAKDCLANILENYVQITEEKDEDTGHKSYKQIFPRYHQLSVVTSLLADAKKDGPGHRYLIQHSAGSGKSNSIAWLAHQLVTLQKDKKDVFDTIIVVTDRINLDKQIRDTIKQFMQVSSTVGWAKDAATLKNLMDEGKKIIITIVHKFQFILDAISADYKNKNFAIIIDEAHSSQNGSLAAKMNIVVSGNVYDDDDAFEDKLNKLIEGKKMASNASYFAFTATPKNKTLEMFGEKMFDEHGNPIMNEDGTQKAKPHYVYTMKQAIEEKFILDVLRYYTTYNSYYHIVKTVESDPLFDKKQAQRMLRYYVETQKIAVKEKAGIIVEHFHTEVRHKIKGQGRAMVVANSIKRAIEYYMAISKLLEERKSPYKAMVAFSGDYTYEGVSYNEAKLNGFPSSQIEKTFRKDPYRLLIVANKFQTGYDEPLLHTMYVDKGLSDIKAVQTLSRLNRCHSDKNDVFVLDFQNDAADIKVAFDKYYKTTILSGETDANKLNDLVDEMEPLEVYDDEEVTSVAELYLNNADRTEIDSIIDKCVERYKELEFEEQIDFKSSAKTFVRTYNFLSAILPYGSMEWEKLSIFLSFLISKLPKPDDGNIDEITEDVELESYRLIAQDTISIKLEDEDSEIDAVPVKTDVGIPVPELDTLSNIIATFHDIWGNCEWTDEDRIKKQIADLPDIVAQDEFYQNAMKYSDAQNARDESDRATKEAIFKSVTSGMELYNAFQDDVRNKNNQSFQKWLLDFVFTMTYKPENKKV